MISSLKDCQRGLKPADILAREQLNCYGQWLTRMKSTDGTHLRVVYPCLAVFEYHEIHDSRRAQFVGQLSVRQEARIGIPIRVTIWSADSPLSLSLSRVIEWSCKNGCRSRDLWSAKVFEPAIVIRAGGRTKVHSNVFICGWPCVNTDFRDLHYSKSQAGPLFSFV